MTILNRRAPLLLLCLLVLVAFPRVAKADCTSPSATESTTKYDYTAHALNICTGTSWISLSGGSSSGTAGYIQFSNGSGGFSSDSTASGQLYWDSTNHRLGIGITSPLYLLHLSATNTAASGTSIQMRSDMTASPASTSSAYPTSGYFGVDYVVSSVTSTGGLKGIETAASSYATGADAGNLYGAYLGAYNIGTGTATNLTGAYGRADNGTSAGTVTNAYGFRGGITGAGTMTNAYGLQVNVASTGTVTNAYGIYTQITGAGTFTKGYGLYIGSIAGTTKYSLYANDATAPSYFAGSVGIGTTTPSNILSFGGEAARIIGMERTSAGTNGFGLTISAGGAKSATADLNGGDLTLSSGTATGTGSSNIYLKSAAAQGSSASTDNASATRMTILGNGNIGIGTNSPMQLLHVHGANSNLTSAAGNVFVTTSAANGADVGGSMSMGGLYSTGVSTPTQFVGLVGRKENATDGNYAGYFALFTRPAGAAIAERMRVTSAGNVGIGTTSPQATLDVSGYMRMSKNSSQPVSCSATNDGAIAETSQYTLCICKGGATSWVNGSDGTTACSW